MKKFALFFCFCICSLMIYAQAEIVLKHQQDTTILLKLQPYKYSAIGKCKDVDLNVTFAYNQMDEIITATISCINEPAYNLMWMPPKDNKLFLSKKGKLKKQFKMKYDVKLALSHQFKKQIKEAKALTEFHPINYSGCEFMGCSVQETARYTKGDSSKLRNEMFYLDKMYSEKIKLNLNFKVLNKATTVGLSFFGFVPFQSKQRLASYQDKLQMQYISDGPKYSFKIQRDPCIDAIEAIDKINSLIQNMQSDSVDMNLASATKKYSDCEQIKNDVIKQVQELDINGKYNNSVCQTLLSAVSHYNSLSQYISNFACTGGPCNCTLSPRDLNAAAADINKLVTKYIVNKKTDISEIPNIIKKMKQRISAQPKCCKQNSNYNDAIKTYNGAEKFYNKEVKGK